MTLVPINVADKPDVRKSAKILYNLLMGLRNTGSDNEVLLMKGGIPRKGLIAHWQNSDVSSQIIVVCTFLSI